MASRAAWWDAVEHEGSGAAPVTLPAPPALWPRALRWARQDWQACESVQRGLSSPHAVPGPLSPDEDAVYQFVAMVARGYQGERVGNTGVTAPGS